MAINSKGLLLIALTSALLSCGDDEKKPKATLALQMQAVGTAGQSANSNALTLARDETECSASYKASNSQSGPATSFKVFVKKIVIDDYDAETRTGGAPVTIFESSDAGGAELELTSGKVDMSSLLDYDAGLAALEPDEEDSEDSEESDLEEGTEGVVAEVEPKTYRRIQLTLVNRALIKGCITADWQGDANPGAQNCAEGESAQDLCDPLTSGSHTFCTRSAYGSAAVFADAANIPTSIYEGGSPEEVEVPLEWWNNSTAIGTDLTSEVTYRFNTPPIVVDADNQPTLTLALDLNTILAFEANTRADGTNPFNSGNTSPVTYDKAFFYTERMGNQMMAFLGESGSVHGYNVHSCYRYDDGNPNNTDDRAVKSWMTVIFDAAGDIVTGLITPTDSAGMVLLKGDIKPQSAKDDGTFDLDICGGYDVTPGGTCSQLNNYRPLDTVGQSNDLPKEDMIPTGSFAGSWEYTREL